MTMSQCACTLYICVSVYTQTRGKINFIKNTRVCRAQNAATVMIKYFAIWCKFHSGFFYSFYFYSQSIFVAHSDTIGDLGVRCCALNMSPINMICMSINYAFIVECDLFILYEYVFVVEICFWGILYMGEVDESAFFSIRHLVPTNLHKKWKMLVKDLSHSARQRAKHFDNLIKAIVTRKAHQ